MPVIINADSYKSLGSNEVDNDGSLDGHLNEKRPIMCTEDIFLYGDSEQNEGVLSRRRCYSDGHLYHPLQIPLRGRKQRKCRDVITSYTQTSPKECLHNLLSDIESEPVTNKVLSPDKTLRKRCLSFTVVSFVVFGVIIGILIWVVIDHIHQGKQSGRKTTHVLNSTVNHRDTELAMHHCPTFSTYVDKDTCTSGQCATNGSWEVSVPWNIVNSNNFVIQQDSRHFKIRSSSWYTIKCTFHVHSLSTTNQAAGRRSAALCITIQPKRNEPICNNITMLPDVISPLSVSTRTYLKMNDVIAIVMNLSNTYLSLNSKLEIYTDICKNN